MQRLSLILILLLLPVALHGKEKAVILKPSTLTLSVDAEGKPSKVACAGNLAEPMCSILVRAVSRWEFAPARIAGANVAMDSRLVLTMEATPTAGGFGIRAIGAHLNQVTAVADESFIQPESRRLSPPRYPLEEQIRGVTGTVVLELWRQPETDVPRIGKAWFNQKPAGKRHRLAQSTIDAAKAWRLTPGNPNQLSLCIPVEFLLDKSKPTLDTTPCKPTFVEGYAPPTLVTDWASAVF